MQNYKVGVDECDDWIGILHKVNQFPISPEEREKLSNLRKLLVSAKGLDLPTDAEILAHSESYEG